LEYILPTHTRTCNTNNNWQHCHNSCLRTKVCYTLYEYEINNYKQVKQATATFYDVEKRRMQWKERAGGRKRVLHNAVGVLIQLQETYVDAGSAKSALHCGLYPV